jgi:Fe-S-cluster containining protein
VSKAEPLSCLECPGFCCKMAGLVEVSAYDIRRLAKHFRLTVPQFEEKHIVEVTRRGKKHIKSEFGTCQFLSADHRCTVYEARPKDCREYVCWNQDDTTVYDFAKFLQLPVAKQRELDDAAEEKAASDKRKARR